MAEQEYWNLEQSGVVRNRGPRGVSGYKGVCVARNNRWRVVLYVGRRQIYVGMFDSKVDAAIAYCRAIQEYHEYLEQ